MKLLVPQLKREEGSFFPFSERISLQRFGSDLQYGDESFLAVEFQAAYINSRVILKGKWKAEVSCECSRCLERFSYSLEEKFYDEFRHLPGSSETSWKNEIELDENEGFVFKGDVLYLSEYFRQQFLINQPLKFLCHSECKGLCPVCGINRNREHCACEMETLDPRWALLEKVREKQKNQ